MATTSLIMLWSEVNKGKASREGMGSNLLASSLCDLISTYSFSSRPQILFVYNFMYFNF